MMLMSTLRNFILLLIVLACTGNVQAKTYYLCVGIANYPGTRNDLTLPARDALTMQRLYQKQRPSEGYCLTNEQATSRAIVNVFETLCVKAQKDDEVIFFFSGHGADGVLLAYDNKLSYTYLYDALSKTKASRKFVFIDACLSGKMRQSPAMYQPTDKQKQTDVMFFLSSRSNEYSIEDRRLKNGFFTLYLERGMRGAADNDRNRVITAKELFGFVSQGVKAISNGRQHPVMWGRFSDAMAVITW